MLRFISANWSAKRLLAFKFSALAPFSGKCEQKINREHACLGIANPENVVLILKRLEHERVYF
jgi:hypothetical protein